jgi:hypothetical protein
VEAGWFLRCTVELEDGLDQLGGLVTALMAGDAREYVSVQGGTMREAGYRVDHPGGSRVVTEQSPHVHLLERRLAPWRQHADEDGP